MRTLREALVASAQQYPAQIAITLGSSRHTYRQLLDAVECAARSLSAVGIGSETTVALLFQNTPDSIISFLALAWLHARVIPLEPTVAVGELAATFERTPFAALLGLQSQLAQLGEGCVPPACRRIDLSDLSRHPAPDIAVAPPAIPSPAFVYHYTSGSTGEPKAAIHSQENLINGGLIYQQVYAIGPEDRILVPIPLLHSFGMVGGLVAALVSGAQVVLTERFIPHRLITLLAEERITLLLAVPLMYDLLARCALHAPIVLDRLRICLSSGGPLPPNTAERFTQRYQRPILQVYGCTEVGIIAARQPDDLLPAGSIGRVMPGVRVRIVDDQGSDLPPNMVGHLLAQTPAMFFGYLNHPETTAQALQDGWYITGDMARQDDQGYLYIEGRKDTFINVGGKKVNPVEVEDVLRTHPMVQDAVAFGCDVAGGSQQVLAVVIPCGAVSEDELVALCRSQLTAHKVPSRIAFRQELPKTSLGKIRRTLLAIDEVTPA